MCKNLSFVLFLLFPSFLFAQISNVIPNSFSVANASVADIDRWSAFVNPASIVSLEQPTFGVQYENRFLLSELSTKSLMAAFPTKFVNIGVSGSYFGYTSYNEILLGVGFARNFADKFSLGVQFNYQTAYFASANRYYGALFPQIGLSIRLSPSFQLGFNTFNPFQTKINTELSVKQLASVFSLASTYRFSTDLLIRLQVDKELSSDYRVAGGLEYTMLDILVFKAGAYDIGYLIPCIGIETQLNKFNINLNSELHPLLGLINSCSVVFKLSRYAYL
jgi:hypothetical protein